METLKNHWEKIYRTRSSKEVSWYQSCLQNSIEMILRMGLGPDDPIIDVGGGASTLVDSLLDRNFKRITVLDISAEAMNSSKMRLGTRAEKVNWIEGDIRAVNLPVENYAMWHDRAVFHFLTQPEDRKKYAEILNRSLKSKGHVIIAAFSPKGPERCSGLPVVRYSPQALLAELKDNFKLVQSLEEEHITPGKMKQHFIYCHFRKSS